MSSRFGVRRARLLAAVLAFIVTAAPSAAQMPDPSQMSGVPLPSPELAPGTITIRVVRGSLSNNISGQGVELAVQDSAARTGTTDASGRAEFAGLRPGQQVRASTVVDGQRLESQLIAMPAQGGIRVMLFAPAEAPAAGDPAPTEPPNLRTASPGVVVLGGETRFIVEQADESLSVFYILEIVNTARTPVDPGGPLLFDLPTGATGATLLPGSTPQATVGGTRVTVTGPFAPGKTSLQVGYGLPYRGARVQIQQVFPAALTQLAVAGETTGGVTMTSTQFAATRDMNADGRLFKVGNGDGLAAGAALTVVFDNLPHHARWPRFTAFGAAVAIMAIGLLVGFRRGAPGAGQTPREGLAAARDGRLAEIDALEARRRAGAVGDEAYHAERQGIIASLEDVYAAIDGERA